MRHQVYFILGGIYGGVFTPTEAAAVAAIYAFFIATFAYRDMGPLKDTPWLSSTENVQAHRGFNAIIYAVSCFFVFLVMSFFVTSGMNGDHYTLASRSLLGGVLSVIVLF